MALITHYLYQDNTMEVIINKGQIEDIAVIAWFQVDMAMESEGTLLDIATLGQKKIGMTRDELI